MATKGHNAVATEHGGGAGRRREGAVAKCIHTWLERGLDVAPRGGGRGGEVKGGTIDGGLTPCEGKTMRVEAEVSHRWWRWREGRSTRGRWRGRRIGGDEGGEDLSHHVRWSEDVDVISISNAYATVTKLSLDGKEERVNPDGEELSP